MSLADTGTILVIDGIDIQRYSARGLSQTFETIEESTVQQRTVDGVLHDLSLDQFRKFRSTITCEDFDTPAIDGIYPGQQVVVDCVFELAYEDPLDEVEVGENASRPIVPDSARVKNGFVRYRPQLTMTVVRYSITRNEYNATSSWTLELVET